MIDEKREKNLGAKLRSNISDRSVKYTSLLIKYIYVEIYGEKWVQLPRHSPSVKASSGKLHPVYFERSFCILFCILLNTNLLS